MDAEVRGICVTMPYFLDSLRARAGSSHPLGGDGFSFDDNEGDGSLRRYSLARSSREKSVSASLLGVSDREVVDGTS